MLARPLLFFKYERDKCRAKSDHVRRRGLDPVILRFSVSYKISRDGIAPPRDATNKRHAVLASQSLNSLALLPASPSNLLFPVSGGRSSTPNSLRCDPPPSSGKSSGTSSSSLFTFTFRFHGSSVDFSNNEGILHATWGPELSCKKSDN